MMPSLTEGKLIFEFPNDWQVEKFDEWSFYLNQFQNVCGGTKAVDVLALDPDLCVWMIEIKDYREHQREKIMDLPMEAACKVRDSLAAIIAAAKNANDRDEKQIAKKMLTSSKKLRVILHLEQPVKPSKLFPRAIDPAKIEQKLKQLLKAIDAHPRVLEMKMDRMRKFAWAVNATTPVLL
ncbi:MAG: hypothetical protein GY862_19935 [Gammaproteobacteria bacterium]|nr:hypothetical protein [Gammaproteobacteria bacterium]